MKSLFRVIVIWLMLVLAPLQGVAAASMLLCGQPTGPAPAHDHAAMLAAQAGASAAQHHAASDAGSHHGHSLASSAGLAAGDGHASTHGNDAGSKHCGGMSACCVGAAVPPSMPIAPVLAQQPAPPFSLLLAAPAAVDPARLERPPKSRLA